jgi:hypothetical protein
MQYFIEWEICRVIILFAVLRYTPWMRNEPCRKIRIEIFFTQIAYGLDYVMVGMLNAAS